MAATPIKLFEPKLLVAPSDVLYTVPAGKTVRILKMTIALTGTAEAAISIWLKPASQMLGPANQIVLNYSPVQQATSLHAIEGHIMNAGDQIIAGNTKTGTAVIHGSGVEF